MDKDYIVNICGNDVPLPIIQIKEGLKVAFFNLHGNQELTEHCAKHLANIMQDCEVLITAESKGLQLCHCVAKNLGHKYYAVARKSKKIYMQDGIEVALHGSIIHGEVQYFYLSHHDTMLLEGKRVGIIDDVISTGNSVRGLEELIKKAGGIVQAKGFVLAEGKAVERDDIRFLAPLPLF